MRATIERAEPSGVEEALASQVRKKPPSPDWDEGMERGPKDRDRNIRLTEGEFDRGAKTKEGRTHKREGPHPCYGLDMDPPARSLGCSLRKKWE